MTKEIIEQAVKNIAIINNSRQWRGNLNTDTF